MKKIPKVSVVMSVYNVEKYLSEAVESILKQTFKDFEFLIINDGSSDSSAEILKAYNDPRIEIIDNKKNIGLTRSLNKGLRLARGEYIARQDADDISLPRRIEKQVDFLNTKPEYGLVGCWNYRIGANNKIEKKVTFYTDHNDIVSMLLIKNHFVHSSVMFRKECIEKLGGYDDDLKFSQDYDLWLRIAEHYKVANLGEFLHYWRYEKHGISHKMSREQGKYAYMIRDAFIKRVLKKEEWQKILKRSFKKSNDPLIKKHLKEITYRKIQDDIVNVSKRKMRIIAIMSAFNEEDIIGQTVSNLIDNGIDIYFIDHHSIDKTLDIAKSFLGKGVKKIEIFPEESGYPSELKDIYAWRYILRRKEELHSTLRADWYMHMDADAIVESPWENMTFIEAVQLVDALGYNCINFELFNFRPIIVEYKSNSKPQDFFEYWEPANVSDELQIKCWKNLGQKIDLVSSGGHNVKFKGKKVFPLKFIMRHYPIRSRSHGIKKVFSERRSRFDLEEKSKGWHSQYDRYVDEKDIQFNKESLLKYDGDIVKHIYLPLINCLSILEEKNKIIKKKDYQILSLYSSRTWKVGRFATAPWRWGRNIAERIVSLFSE
jgi:glycosyltransferase involved in cell wall biosynthesis